MGLLKKFFNQTRKPEGLTGKLMLYGMNKGHAALADWGMSYLPSLNPEQIADFGCGAGRNIGELLKKYPSAKGTGMDYSALSVEKSRKYNRKTIAEGRCRIEEGDVSAPPFSNESFDLVSAFETIYFWPGLEKCFSEVYRVLKKDGLFLIVNESDGFDASSKQFETIIEGMKVYTAADIECALKEAGFRKITVYHHTRKPWIAVTAEK